MAGAGGDTGGGCPTHVGIDLMKKQDEIVRLWLPHTRGDRPKTRAGKVWKVQAAPHTWG